MSTRVFALRLSTLALTTVLAAACGDGGGSGNFNDQASLQPGLGQCLLTFSMIRGEGVQNLSARINIERGAAAPVTKPVNNLVECINVIGRGSATLTVPNYCDQANQPTNCENLLSLSMVLDPDVTLDAPEDFLRCLFEPNSDADPDPDGFVFTNGDASDEKLRPIPFDTLEFAVTDVDCEEGVGTSTTSTTMPGCLDTTCEANQACVDDMCVATDLYEIAFELIDDEDVGALQCNIFYDAQTGAFDGVGAQVDCTGNPALNAHTLYNHVLSPELPVGARRENRLIFSHVALAGFRGPIRLGQCRFRSEQGVPDSGAFRIEVVDASSPELVPLRVEVVVESIRPLASDATEQ